MADLEEPADDADVGVEATFDAATFDVSQQMYGLLWLLRKRTAMAPDVKPAPIASLKFLICADGYGGPDAEPAERERDKDRLKSRDGKSKGKGKDKKGGQAGGGRNIPGVGKTEIMPGSGKGTWWRNMSTDGMDVIVREQFHLTSDEVSRVPPGQYVLQAGPLEVFVNGPATGLQRLPVQPQGWVTVDATSVGGPLYLEKVTSPRWKVVFSSGSMKGDIVVRQRISLDSAEVAVLTCGTHVDQAGPLEMTEDGIVRMPISFADGAGREPLSSSSARTRTGWVTCDATAQGGPKFFEPVSPQEVDARQRNPAAQSSSAIPDDVEEDEGATGPLAMNVNSWESNRIWKVSNVDDRRGEQLPIVKRPEPFAPGTGRIPPEDLMVRLLHNGDVVEQIGHSKKVRGYMVMPVKIEQDEGWVVRRVVDKNRESTGVWFHELVNGQVRDRRKSRRDRED